MKNKDLQKNSQRLTRNKLKSESVPEVYTTLSTGRVSKQRLPLTPIKSAINKRKRKADVSEDESSSDDDQQDEDYHEKYVNRKAKQESGAKRQHSRDDEDGNDNKPNLASMHHLPAIQIPLDSSKSPDELDFLIRLNTFMAERAQSYPKLIWGLRDGEFASSKPSCDLQFLFSPFSQLVHDLHARSEVGRLQCHRRQPSVEESLRRPVRAGQVHHPRHDEEEVRTNFAAIRAPRTRAARERQAHHLGAHHFNDSAKQHEPSTVAGQSQSDETPAIVVASH